MRENAPPKWVTFDAGPDQIAQWPEVTFDKPGNDGIVAGAVHHQAGRDFKMKRIKRPPLSAMELKDREGEFYSDELHVLYSISSAQGEPQLRYPRGEVQLQRGVDANTFSGGFPIGSLHYTCAPDKKCDGFAVSDAAFATFDSAGSIHHEMPRTSIPGFLTVSRGISAWRPIP